MVKVKEEWDEEGGGEEGVKMPAAGTSNLATQHFHYHWSYPPTGSPAPATFHFGPGFEPQTSPHQHVVYFHVNPGVTVSFQMGDTVQVIKGKSCFSALSVGLSSVQLAKLIGHKKLWKCMSSLVRKCKLIIMLKLPSCTHFMPQTILQIW